MENLLFLGVPILKHIRVILTESLFMEMDLKVSLISGGAGDGGSLCMVPLLICQ